MTDPRHRQLSRIYQRPIEDDEDARAAIAADPGVLASALFLEAAQSDDVTSLQTARAYLAERLDYLGVDSGGGAAVVTDAFEKHLSAWR